MYICRNDKTMPTPLKKLKIGSTIYTDYFYRVESHYQTDFGKFTTIKNCKTGEIKTVDNNLKFTLIVKK